MPEVPFATQAYAARYKGLPALTLENMFVEDSPKEALDEVHLIQAPGRTQVATLAGTGRGLWRVKGGPTSSLVAVHGSTVSLLDAAFTPTPVGSVLAQDAPVKIASSPDDVAICDDPNLYVYNGSSFAQVNDVDLGPVTDVAYSSAGYWGCIRAGELKLSAFGDPTDWDTLDYVGVGQWPDDNVAMAEDDGDFILWGEEAIKRYSPSGDSSAPFYPVPGSRIDKGCVASKSVIFAGTWFWAGREREASGPGIYQWPGKRISTFAIDDALTRMSEADRSLIKGSTYTQGGHTFVQFDLPGQGTFAYDVGFKRWHRRRQFHQTLDRVMAFEEIGGKIVGQGRDGGLFHIDPTVFVDGSDPLRWAYTANVPLVEGRETIWSFQVQGTSGEILDPNADPMLFMRYSAGDGASWSSLRNASLGRMGERRKRVKWTQLGEIRPPGRVFEVSGDAAARWTPTRNLVNADF